MVQVASILSADPVPNLRQHFGITISTKLFFYTFNLILGVTSLKDVKNLLKNGGGASLKPGFGGGFFVGKIEIQERTGPGDNDPIITQFELPVVVAQVGIGGGVSFGSSNTGKTSTPFHWTAADFSGVIKIVDLSFGAFAWAPGITGVFFGGAGRLPELAADFTGMSWNFGISFGLTEAMGMVGPFDPARPGFTTPEKTPYDGNVTLTRSVHFPFGDAELTSEARQLLRVMAAQELSVFKASFATLVVESHADRVDTEEFNVLLTKCRAFNTMLALKDILGDKTFSKITDRHQLGLGETGAIKAGDKDDTENPEQRRSDVSVNGRLVVQLQGEGKSSP
jgi:outer membrane protein OmpA-like peptidoglycan-associated protein